MTLQEVLFIISIVFFVLAVIFVGLAVFIFFARNVPDVRADLSGKKKAEEVATMRGARPGRERRKGVATRAEVTSGSLTEGDSSMIGGIRSAEPVQQAQDETAGRRPGSDDASASKPKASQGSKAPKRAGTQAGAVKSSAKARPEQKPKPEPDPQDDSAETTILADDTSSTTILEDDASATTVLADIDSSATSPKAESTSLQAFEADHDSAGRAVEAEAQTEGEFDLVGTSEEEQSLEKARERLQPVQQATPFEVVDKIILTDSVYAVRCDKGEVVRVKL